MDGVIDFEDNLQEIVEPFYKVNVPFFEKKGFGGLQKFFSSENRVTSLTKQQNV